MFYYCLFSYFAHTNNLSLFFWDNFLRFCLLHCLRTEFLIPIGQWISFVNIRWIRVTNVNRNWQKRKTTARDELRLVNEDQQHVPRVFQWLYKWMESPQQKREKQKQKNMCKLSEKTVQRASVKNSQQDQWYKLQWCKCGCILMGVFFCGALETKCRHNSWHVALPKI